MSSEIERRLTRALAVWSFMTNLWKVAKGLAVLTFVGTALEVWVWVVWRWATFLWNALEHLR